jgi:regulator of sigma E protease
VELHLIGEFSILGVLNTAYTILKVAIGLGLVIFVHELGHFLVAKLCGVKCEKFYLGFDIGGWKLAKFQWGETEYGIGILPLGGYVKMLGQDDNPARIAEERERARLKEQHAAAVAHSGDLPHEPTADEREEQVVFDPRSYMAKSVPQRMAIISAGVIMNLIFAVIFAAVAYRFGVRYTPTVIGGTTPGYPAWQAGIQPGDKIVQIGNQPVDGRLRFREDLQTNILLTGANDSIQLGIQRPDSAQVDTVELHPTEIDKADKNLVVIGIVQAGSTVLGKEPVAKDSPAAKATPEFKEGDKICAVRRREKDNRQNNDYPKQKIGDYFGLQEIQYRFADRPLEYYVQRPDPQNPKAEPSEVKIVVEPNRMRVLGLVMAMGPITAIQNGSPAEKAGFRKGDKIVSIDGNRDVDPLRIGELLQRTDRDAKIEVERGGATTTISVTPRSPRNFIIAAENGPVGCDELGVAYTVLNTVQSVEPGSPADGNILPGDEINSAKLPSADDDEKEKLKKMKLDEPIAFDEKTHNWPFFHSLLQELVPAGHKVELSWTHSGEKKQAVLETVEAKSWFNPDRGLVVKTLSDIRQVDSWGDAFRLGLRETKESVWQVTTTLRKLIHGDISLSGFGGPITIARVAGETASEGITRLLIFLTLLSANLAVLNFLPIPVLDGGHMMFLLYEGIRGKPASERTMMALTYAGLIFILALMIFVLGMDIFRLFS